MAKHREQRRRRTPGALVMSTTAVAVSSVLAAGQLAENQVTDLSAELLATIYGVGGSNDKTGANIPAKLNGELIGIGDTYRPIVYTAGIPLDPSVEEAIPVLREELSHHPDGEEGVVVGYSEGAIVVEYVRRNLQADLDAGRPAPSPDDVRFIQIAGPSVPNGGIYARFTYGIIPGFTTTGPTQATEYDTTYVTIEYDPASDFPAYFNPLAIANSLIAFFPTHPDPSYNAADIDSTTNPPITKTVENSAGGEDTYVFFEVDDLQILWPVRLVSELGGTTPLTEPFLDLIEPALRVLIDMGYTDRVNANPEEHVPFSLITPPEKIVEAAVALPGAFEQGWQNFQDGTEALAPTTQEPEDTAVLAATDESSADDSSEGSADDAAESDDRDVRPGIRLMRQLREEVRDALSQRPGATSTPAHAATEDDSADDAVDEVESDLDEDDGGADDGQSGASAAPSAA